MPSGSVNIGDQTRITPINSVVSNINDLLELPIRTGAGPTVFVRDVGIGRATAPTSRPPTRS